ncbi:AsmA family protein [Oceanospirillum sediminis]|uniref:AsmA family protein n=1 Tax=Oceanospirillum sediminis TaxID=2760088 RepID=A0A839IPP3_9GAMM|nr:AsmA family protein [Oceanospirillum sediminis]
MKLLFKSLAYLISILLAIIIALVIYLTQFLDANSYKPLIMEQAAQAGVPLELNGDLEISVYPWLGARIAGVRVLHPETRDPAQPFARIDEAGIKLKLMPLLTGAVEVDRILLDGLYADIEIDQQGRGNWEVFIPKADKSPEQAGNEGTGEPSADQPTASGNPLTLAVAGIDITNTQLNFTDHSQQVSARIEQLELHSDSITLKKNFPFSLKTRMTSRNPDLTATLDLNSQVYLDLSEQHYRLSDLKLNAQAQSPLIGPTPVKLSVSSALDARMDSQQISIQQLAVQVRDLVLQAEGSAPVSANLDLSLPEAALNLAQQRYQLPGLEMKLFAQTPAIGQQPFSLDLKTGVDANLQSGAVSVPELMLTLSKLSYQPDAEARPIQADLVLKSSAQLNLNSQRYTLPGLTINGQVSPGSEDGKSLPVKLMLSADADLSKQVAELKPSQLKLGDITITIQALARQLKDNPLVEGGIRIDEFVPAEFLQQLNIALPERADPETLQSFSLISRLQLKDNLARLHDLTLKADDSTLKGQAGMNLLSQALMADLALDQINLDRYLPPPAQTEETTGDTSEPKTDQPSSESGAPADTGAAKEPELIPVDLLKPLKAKARLTIDQLQVKQHPIRDVLLDVSAENGLVKLNAANLALYQGTVTNQATLDLNQQPIRMKISHRTKGVEIKPLLMTASEFDGFEGTTHLQADMTASTRYMSTIMASLNGNASFNVLKGAFNRINVPKELCYAAGGQVQVAEWSPNTDFTSMKGDIRFTNGIGNNENLTVAIPGVTITGFGLVNLPASEFTYNIGANITNANDKVCKVKSTLKAIRWPAECKGGYGTGLDFGCVFDVAAIGDTLKNIARQELQATLDKEEARLKAKLAEEQDELRQKLKAEQKRAEEKARKELERALQKLF